MQIWWYHIHHLVGLYFITFIYLFICMYVYVKARGQLWKSVSSAFPPCGPWRLNSGLQPWSQAPVPASLILWLWNFILIYC